MKIAVLSKVPFPEGSAASTYVLNVCRVMRACGHEVTMVGCLRSKPERYPVNGEIDGIAYQNFPGFTKHKLFMYLYDNHWQWYAIHTLAKMKDLDVIFLYGGWEKEAKAVHGFCKRHGILYGAFNAEWYTPESFTSATKKSTVKQALGLIPYNATHADLAIQISTLLTEHFQNNGIPSLFAPNIVDLQDPKWDCRKPATQDGILKLAYAGVPGVGKDELATVVRAIGLLPEEKRAKTQLHIYGPREAELLYYLQSQGVEEIPPYVICHGRQKQNEVPGLLNDCHYTVLVRKPNLRTNAGFSTKMVESFAAGIPMLANITGDMGAYLKNGVNGIVAVDESDEACRDALISAWEQLDRNDAMRTAAYATAQEYFDYRKHIDRMQQFLQSVKKN